MAADELVRVDAGGWGFTWVAGDNGVLRQVAVGAGGHEADVAFPASLYPPAYPTWGGGDPHRRSALRITHADGTLTTRLVLDRVERCTSDDDGDSDGDGVGDGDGRLHGGTRRDDGDGDGSEHVVVSLRDEVFDLTVELHARTHTASSVLEQWVEVVHHEDGPVRLHDYDSIAPLLLVPETAEVHSFVGSGWVDEWRWTTSGLVPGTAELASFGGLQPHLQMAPCLLLSPFGPTTEAEGEAVGLSVAWGGNVRFGLDVRPRPEVGAPRDLRVRAGANPVGADYALDPDRRFVTPTVAWTWSTEGRGEVTRRFHRWTRDRVLRDPERVRPIVANNWEATFFDFDQDRIVDLIGRAADLGADVFLLDDGWFGTDHPRDDDTTSLGDWDPDPRKLPNGLAPLAAAAEERGIRFGIWVEPEMVNPVSTLHDDHPDWVLRNRREPLLHRHQLALDPLLAEVRSFGADVVDRALGAHPAITYVKWDANRPITDPGSGALAADRQSNLWVDHVHATWDLMAEVARRHPDTELMLCASGGGRTDHGTLRHFHEVWTSDNTDPVVRVRMQWASGHFFPASVTAAHVTRWGGRPMDFACAVALSGRFGLDLDLAGLTADELATCRRAVSFARRTQALVQTGDVVRMISPVEGEDRSRAAWAVVDGDRHRAVAFAYQLDDSTTPPPSALRIDRLDPAVTYRVTTTDLASTEPPAEVVASGRELAESGLEWELTEPCTAWLYEIESV